MKDKLVKNINFPVPIKEYQRLRNLKEEAGAKSWFEFLCLDKLDLTKRHTQKGKDNNDNIS